MPYAIFSEDFVVPLRPNFFIETMNQKLKGIAAGVLAAMFYGTNPLGAKFIYQDGLNTMSTVFWRYAFAVAILAIAVKAFGHSFKVSRRELGICAYLGVFFSLSSITLYASFNYMDAGLASTILFCYPIMVAVAMTAIFKEKFTLPIALSLALVVAGIILLGKGDTGVNTSLAGVLWVIGSSATYSVYIISVNRLKLSINNFTLTFYVSVFGMAVVAISSLFGSGNQLMMLPNLHSVVWAAQLGFMPTVLSLIFMNISIKNIGSTAAAILGALEPVTAVFVGHFVFGEAFTLKLLFGIVLILAAVIIVILKDRKAEKIS